MRNAIFIFLLASIILAAENPDRVEKGKELERLRREIAEMEKQIAETEKRETKLSSALEAIEEMHSLRSRLLGELEGEIKQTELKLKRVRGKIKKVELDISIAGDEIERLEGEIDRYKKIVAHRAVYIYKHWKWDELRLLLSAQDFNQAAARKKFFRIVAKRDRRNIEILKRKKVEQNEYREKKLTHEKSLVSANLDLFGQLRYKQGLIDETRSETRKLEKDRDSKSKLLKKIKIDREYLDKQLSKKKAAAVEIESLIRKLDEDIEQREKIAYIFPDLDFPKLKGIMEWPVKGRIVSRFGVQKNPKLNTWIENTGIEIEAASGTEVRAVASGVVTVITYRRGYGTILMISHPGRYYTVYAHLDRVFVGKNSSVRGGSVIGSVGGKGSGSKGRLHFELWAKQKKQNPELWLKKKG